MDGMSQLEKWHAQNAAISVDSKFLDDFNGDHVIGEATCVIHPEGVESHSMTQNPHDDIPISSLEKFDLSNKPVTMDHGEWNPRKEKWDRKPTVVGHVKGTTLDDDGRLIGHFVLHRTPSGIWAHDQIVRREKIDVSPYFFHTPRFGGKGNDKIEYRCNHLALTPEGRRHGTHILSLKSKMKNNSPANPKNFRLSNPHIVNRNKKTREATDILFDPDPRKVEVFFTGTEDVDGFFLCGRFLEDPMISILEIDWKYELFMVSRDVS